MSTAKYTLALTVLGSLYLEGCKKKDCSADINMGDGTKVSIVLKQDKDKKSWIFDKYDCSKGDKLGDDFAQLFTTDSLKDKKCPADKVKIVEGKTPCGKKGTPSSPVDPSTPHVPASPPDSVPTPATIPGVSTNPIVAPIPTAPHRIGAAEIKLSTKAKNEHAVAVNNLEGYKLLNGGDAKPEPGVQHETFVKMVAEFDQDIRLKHIAVLDANVAFHKVHIANHSTALKNLSKEQAKLQTSLGKMISNHKVDHGNDKYKDSLLTIRTRLSDIADEVDSRETKKASHTNRMETLKRQIKEEQREADKHKKSV